MNYMTIPIIQAPSGHHFPSHVRTQNVATEVVHLKRLHVLLKDCRTVLDPKDGRQGKHYIENNMKHK